MSPVHPKTGATDAEEHGASSLHPVVQLGAKRHDVDALVRDLKAVIYERDKRLTVAEAIGALECVKLDIWMEQQ